MEKITTYKLCNMAILVSPNVMSFFGAIDSHNFWSNGINSVVLDVLWGRIVVVVASLGRSGVGGPPVRVLHAEVETL